MKSFLYRSNSSNDDIPSFLNHRPIWLRKIILGKWEFSGSIINRIDENTKFDFKLRNLIDCQVKLTCIFIHHFEKYSLFVGFVYR